MRASEPEDDGSDDHFDYRANQERIKITFEADFWADYEHSVAFDDRVARLCAHVRAACYAVACRSGTRH